MPTIQSKKYEDHVHYVTVESWQVFKDKGLDTRYKVIDDSDIQDTVIKAPQAFTEPVSLMSLRWTRDALKDALDSAEVECNPRTSTEKLINYIINCAMMEYLAGIFQCHVESRWQKWIDEDKGMSFTAT